MAPHIDINLLITQTIKSAKYLFVENQLRRGSYAILTTGVVTSALISVIFLVLQQMVLGDMAHKDRLLETVKTNAPKEIAYRMIGAYLPAVAESIQSKKPFDTILDDVYKITIPSTLSRVSIEDDLSVSLRLQFSTIKDAVMTLENFRELIDQKKAASMTLGSVVLEADSPLNITINYVSLAI